MSYFVWYTGAITLYSITEQHIPIDFAGLIIVELKFAAHAYDFYGRVPVQSSINNTTPIGLQWGEGGWLAKRRGARLGAGTWPWLYDQLVDQRLGQRFAGGSWIRSVSRSQWW